MKKRVHQKQIRIASLILAALLLNSCSLREESEAADGIGEAFSGIESLFAGAETHSFVAPASETAAPEAKYSDFDLDDRIPEDAVRLELAGDHAVCESDAVLTEGNVLTIRRAGSYLLSGIWNGQIVVRAGADDNVQLILNGTELTGSMAPLYIRSAKNVSLTLAEGSENRISDTADYSFAEGEDEPDAAVFSKCDLTVNGTGTLAVNGNYACGIRCKDDLKIVSGDLNVTAVTDAVKGRDSLTVCGGTLTIESGEDGLKSNNDEDEEKGYVILDGGEITIRAGDDAVHGESRLIVNGGVIRAETCYEGLEAKKVEIYGGDITLNATDDAINAASGSSAEGGFGFEKDRENSPFGGDGQPPEIPNEMMMDGQPPEKPGGMAMDNQPPEIPDGMPTDGQPPEKPDSTGGFTPDAGNGGRGAGRGGQDQNRGEKDGFGEKGGGFGGFGGRIGGGGMNGGGGMAEAPEEGVYILIAGGVIRASGRDSDVIDSNGTFEQTGGVLITESAKMTMYGEPDGILDANGDLVFSGGTFVSLCRSAGSGYESLFAYPSVSVSLSGTESRIALTAADGTVLLDLVPEESCRTLFAASDALIPGEEYSLTLDGETVTFTAAEGNQTIR